MPEPASPDFARAPAVAAASAADADRAVAVLLLAFANDPMARWSFPDPALYLTHFPAVVRAFGGNAFAHGTAHHAEDFAGSALWLPPGIAPDVEAMAAVMQEASPPERQAEGADLFEQMEHYHPDAPHWYLPMIGVDPRRQGSGIGSALLRHALAECDRTHLAAYLESSNPANVPFYERHGFRALGAIKAGSSPTLVPMLRDAR